MRLNVIGLGTVGLPTALLFADAGLDVVGVDTNLGKLAAYRTASPDLRLEREVDAMLRRVLSLGRLTFTDQVRASDAHIIAVGTGLQDAVPDLAQLEQALAAVAEVARSGDLIVIESTVPPGTTLRFARNARLPGSVLVGHAPERVSPGAALTEMRSNARVVGGTNGAAGDAMAALYARITSARIDVTDATTAEFVKLIENTYRDVNIALANEVCLMAARIGVDPRHAIRFANQHPRVNLHRPSPGVGGPCVPLASTFLTAADPGGHELLVAARARNRSMAGIVALQLLTLADREHARIALLGTAYKADVADDRCSPTQAIVDALEAAGASCALHDPLLLDVSVEATVEGADAIAVLVAHQSYRSIDPERLAGLVKRAVIVDTVDVLDRSRWEQSGFEVVGLAQSSNVPSASSAR